MAAQINIGDVWKPVTDLKLNIGDTWKPVTKAWINIGDVWKVWWEPAPSFVVVPGGYFTYAYVGPAEALEAVISWTDAGQFSVTGSGNSWYLGVGGGAGGKNATSTFYGIGAGGGAGAPMENTTYSLSAGVYDLSIGRPGPVNSSTGGSSTFIAKAGSTLNTAEGGVRGDSGNGYSGGTGFMYSSNWVKGGGGGGAGGNGSSPDLSNQGHGGAGYISSITGTAYTYAPGGAGGNNYDATFAYAGNNSSWGRAASSAGAATLPTQFGGGGNGGMYNNASYRTGTAGKAGTFVLRIPAANFSITGSNYVANPSFNNSLWGWTAGNGTYPLSATYYNLTSGAPDGGYVLEPIQSQSATSIGSIRTGWPLVAGASYSFSYWWKNRTTPSLDTQYLKTSLTNAIGTETSVLGYPAAQADTAWHQQTYTFTNTSNYAYLQVMFRWLGTAFSFYGFNLTRTA